MTKEAYVDKVIELATSCHTMAETTCKQWRELTSGEESGWQGLSEVRELYFALQMFEHKADAVVERAAILRRSMEQRERSPK